MIGAAPLAGVPGIRKWCGCVVRKGISAPPQVQPGAQLQLPAHYHSNHLVFAVIHIFLCVSIFDHTFIQCFVS